MRVLLYEWCCSGGFVDATPAIASEGRMMLEALAADAVRHGGLEVMVSVDQRTTLELPPSTRVIPVEAGHDIDVLVTAARHADCTLIIAPESGGILADRVAAVRAVGGRVLAPAAGFIDVAADKQATIHALAAAGVPVPAGRLLATGERWPEAFVRPAVRKIRSGAGCEGLVIVRPGDPEPAPSAAPTRLEAFAEGTPVGVSCICGPTGIRPLPAMRQCFSAGEPAAYAGGEPLADQALDARARALATRAINAVVWSSEGAAVGWVGVDMILGRRTDGRDDRVLEVNPRLTTSFVGHALGLKANLVRTMLDAAAGRQIQLPGAPLPFHVMTDDDTRA